MVLLFDFFINHIILPIRIEEKQFNPSNGENQSPNDKNPGNVHLTQILRKTLPEELDPINDCKYNCKYKDACIEFFDSFDPFHGQFVTLVFCLNIFHCDRFKNYF